MTDLLGYPYNGKYPPKGDKHGLYHGYKVWLYTTSAPQGQLRGWTTLVRALSTAMESIIL